MSHPFRADAPARALASVASLLAVAYFVWWGCFVTVLPLTDPCASLCCAECQCCSSPLQGSAPQPYCTLPNEICPAECQTPGELAPCVCDETGFGGECLCRDDGTMDPCAFVLRCDPTFNPQSCFCPRTGASGTCECAPDGTMDPCAFTN